MVLASLAACLCLGVVNGRMAMPFLHATAAYARVLLRSMSIAGLSLNSFRGVTGFSNFLRLQGMFESTEAAGHV